MDSVEPTKVRPAGNDVVADAMERRDFVCDAIRSCADPRAYFQQSASSYLVPPAALSEAIEAIEAYQDEPKLAYKAVVPALKRAKRAIARSRNEAVGSGSFEIDEYVTLAQSAIDRVNDDALLRAFLKERSADLSAAATKAANLYNENSIYIADLSSKIADILRATGKFNSGAKARTVWLARELVAAVANQGRTAEVFAEALCAAISHCKAGDAAGQALEQFMKQPKNSFKVAFVIDGTVRTNGLDITLFRRMDPSKSVSWGADMDKDASPTADLDLLRFCLTHWGIKHSTGATYKHEVFAQVLITEVGAWDENQARHVALDRAEKVVDRINAEHRTSHFGVKRKVMIWRPGQKTAQESFPKGKTLPTTRQMKISDGPSVDRSLRLASRAAGERAGAMQVFFAWIALEYLGRGGLKSPQNLVAENAPYAVALVELRHLLTLAWVQLTINTQAANLPISVRRAVKRGDGPVTKKDKPNEYDMRKLLALIISDNGHTSHLQECAALTTTETQDAIIGWRELRNNLSAYSGYQIERIREILRDNGRFRTHLDEVRLDADETLQRMRFIRNQTAHNAGVGSTEHLALSEASLKILDAVFEVLPLWNSPPHQALCDISSRLKSVRIDVENRENARHMPPFDPFEVLKP